MTISDHTVAIIGTGNIGSTLAANFAPAARTSSWPAATRTRPGRSPLTSAAEAVSIDEAVERADVLAFALRMDAFEQLIVEYGGGWTAR